MDKKIIGVFGSPDIIWNRGESLRDYNINAVFISHNDLDKVLIDRVHSEEAKVFSEIGIFVGKDVVSRCPELAPIGIDGRPLSPIQWYMGINPAIDWYRKEKLSEIENILNNYNIDGLWLDFVRYPCYWEVPNPKLEQSSFDDLSIQKFEKYIGTKVEGETVQDRAKWILEKRLDDWTRWKCMQITLFCKDVRDITNKVKPNILLGMFSVPWKEDYLDNAIHKIIAQDFESLSLYIDIFSPMVYHLMCGFDTSWIVEYSLYLKGKVKKMVIPIIQAVDEPRRVDNLGEIINNVLSTELDGIIIFTTQAVFMDEEKIKTLRETKALK